MVSLIKDHFREISISLSPWYNYFGCCISMIRVARIPKFAFTLYRKQKSRRVVWCLTGKFNFWVLSRPDKVKVGGDMVLNAGKNYLDNYLDFQKDKSLKSVSIGSVLNFQIPRCVKVSSIEVRQFVFHLIFGQRSHDTLSD